MPKDKKSTPEEELAEPKEHKQDKKLDEKILTTILSTPCCDRATIASVVGANIATTNQHILKLKEEGKLQEGLTVTPSWKQQQLKSYIFIYTDYRREPNEKLSEIPYQQQLKEDIERKLNDKPYCDELVLESLSIVLGADFDLILVLNAKQMHSINRLVTAWLRTHPFVVKTQTIMDGPLAPEADT